MGTGIRLNLLPEEFASAVERTVFRLMEDRIVPRIWAKDHTVWKSSPEGIVNRLGWLHVVEAMDSRMDEVDAFVKDVRSAGFSRAVLLGMGGSSLASDVFRRMFPPAEGFFPLEVLDTTHPDAIVRMRRRLNLEDTLFIVATKSGGTVETLSLFKYFFNETLETIPAQDVGRHFCAITDPGSGLESLADSFGFRKIFRNDPDIGGRYSALSFFGLVPAALMGLDVRRILERAREATAACRSEEPAAPTDNPGLWLGAALGSAARAGRDKSSLVVDPLFANFGDWVEQLLAESTGKEGTGILPVVDEPLDGPEVYDDDRLFVRMGTDEWRDHDAAFSTLREAGFPEVRLEASSREDLGALFFVWEFATAVAGHILGINPFDQPNVESAKVQARRMLEAYRETGNLPKPRPNLKTNGVEVYGDVRAKSPEDALLNFVGGIERGGYLGIQVYAAPSAETNEALQRLRLLLRDRSRRAVTVGYGPRFLHSTGQLHKGDAGKGRFLQITVEPERDLPIPDEPGKPDSSVTFGTLIAAQALGDGEALVQAGRPVLRFHVREDLPAVLTHLCASLQS